MRWYAIGFAILTLVLGACDTDDDADTKPVVDEVPYATEGNDGDDNEAHTRGSFTKSGNWPDDIDRIVSMAPNITEILFEIGLGDRVVAVTRYCDWPREVGTLDTIGGVLDPDYEAILGAGADVVVGVEEGIDPRLVDNLGEAGVEYGFVSIEGLASIRQGIDRLGQWFEVEDRARQLIRDFDSDLEAASRRVGQARDMEDNRALMIFDREPVVAAGPGSFGEQLLEAAGLENAVGAESGDYPVLDIEKILSLDPGLIIDVKIDAGDSVALSYWEQFDSLTAVEQGRIFHIDDPVMMRPGPRVPVAVERLAKALEAP